MNDYPCRFTKEFLRVSYHVIAGDFASDVLSRAAASEKHPPLANTLARIKRRMALKAPTGATGHCTDPSGPSSNEFGDDSISGTLTTKV